MMEAVRKGFLDIVVDELTHERGSYSEALDCCTHIALNDTMAKDVAESGIIEPLLSIASHHADEGVGDVALNILVGLSKS